MTAELTHDLVQKLIQLVNRRYPGWKGFSDPRFVEDELRYKNNAIQTARELLNPEELKDLLEKRRFEDFRIRIEQVAQAGKNLLYLAAPRTGDLAVLYAQTLNEPAFYTAFMELLFGEDPSPQRVASFSQFLESEDLPNRWTFATYFLYLLFPKQEMFVKPTTTRWFLRFCGAKAPLPSTPNQEDYALILSLCQQLIARLEPYQAEDMVAVQSLTWAARQEDQKEIISEEKLREFRRLYRRFYTDYLFTDVGKDHSAMLEQSRETARENYEKIRQAVENGDDFTDLVLLKLLPYNDNAHNREKGAWISVAPSIQGDIKTWFENAGWTQPEDWPLIARAIWDFVQDCLENPDRLSEYCTRFSDLPYSTGLQTGMLSPILNALDPENFILVNNKSRNVINYFTDSDLKQTLTYYPVINDKGKSLVDTFEQTIQAISGETNLSAADLFDTFCHWLVAELKYFDQPAKELDEIFSTNQKAIWAFDIFDRAVDTLGISGPDDPLKSMTFYKRNSRYTLRLSYGNWLVLGFNGLSKEIEKIYIALFDNDIDIPRRVDQPFAHQKGEKEVFLYRLSLDEFKAHELEILDVFEETLRHIKNRFSSWKANPYLNSQNAKAAQALFDFNTRKRILQKGLLIGVTPLEDNHWLLSPKKGAFNWDGWVEGRLAFDWEGTGNLASLTEEEIRNVHSKQGGATKNGADTQSLHAFSQLQSGDALILAQENTLLAYGVVVQGYAYQPEENFRHTVTVQWESQKARPLNRTETDHLLINLPPDEFNTLIEAPPYEETLTMPIYTLEQCAMDTSMDLEDLKRFIRAIERKKQAVFYGPPGTGKTFLAEHLAKHLIGGGDGFADLIQFHPGVAYEDFIQGIRPQSDNNDTLRYPMVQGRFLQFCEKAQHCSDICVLIIDEVNRANLSSVFGELMYLLEYRDRTIQLAAGGTFQIPGNVHIIGTMNTADRSIALVDHALRRRFAFIGLYPDYEILKRYHAQEPVTFDPRGLITMLHKINAAIGDRNFSIGPSFFLQEDVDEHLEDIWQMEIEPYLEEYFFDQPEKVERFTWDKVKGDIQL